MGECKSIISFPNEYVMIDTETTGFSAEWDSMIEIGALKIQNGEIVDTFETFVKYDGELPEFITQLTGITNEMLCDAPAPQEAVKAFIDFLGDDMIVGYNVSFDIDFIREDLKKYFDIEMNNDYIDCMRIARKLFPEEKHHRLKDMRKIFGIDVDKEHRASHDCIATKAVFEKLREVAIEKYGDIETFQKSFAHKDLKAGDISTHNTAFDVTHPLFGMTCVFTGTLEKMTRREAMQAVVDVGGAVGDNVTKDTNYLVLGNNDYCTTIKDGKSTKQKKAESLMLKGNDIAIIPENVFYEMLDLPPIETPVNSSPAMNITSEELELYRQKYNIEFNELEVTAIKYIQNEFQNRNINFDDVKIVQRSSNYITLLKGNSDFCRFKASRKSTWYSVHGFSLSDSSKSDHRFDDAEKNLSHWKVKLNNIEDFKTSSDFIVECYVNE